jgi:hypothetical protein
MSTQKLHHKGLVREVEELNEQVRLLAIKLAGHLGRERDSDNRLASFEADFQQLVSGIVTLVGDVSGIIEATQHAPTHGGSNASRKSVSMEEQLASLKSLCLEIGKRLETYEAGRPT